MHFARGLLGMGVLIGIAWLISYDRRRFPVRIVVWGFVLEMGLGLLVLKTDVGRAIFDGVGRGVTCVLRGSDEGAKFVFGPLAGIDPEHPGVTWHAIAGIKIMATIIVFSMLSAIGYHLGILQRVVAALAYVMTRTLRVSGAESLSGAANVFLGQTEAPLFVRPYLAGMTRSELMSVMACGFANIAMGVLAVYVSFLGIDAAGNANEQRAIEVARHLLTASLLSVPAGFILSKIILPEREIPETAGRVEIDKARPCKNTLDAATMGASDGMMLAINVLAMLIAFIALIKIVDIGLETVGELSWMRPIVASLGVEQLSLGAILGCIFSPIAWLIGIDGPDQRVVGSLLGTAMATNEMVAYKSLSQMIKTGVLSDRSVLLAMYALCGFANISSMGIQIGGIGALAPSRRGDLAALAPRAMLAGAMATWMTGCIAGMLS